MITYNYETDFELDNEQLVSDWIETVISNEDKKLGEINYVFCDDDYLHKINVEFLNHDDYTDIISFDYGLGNIVNGDVFISIERVMENAQKFNVRFKEELYRVMIHGILHYLGYKDKTDADKMLMRDKENVCIKILNI